jgi:dinuclear metal center YbgI/SA1388 family protein
LGEDCGALDLSTQICIDMTVSLEAIGRYADTLLETATTKDYPNALNGIQLENRSSIRGIAAAVDFSSRSIETAIATNCNLLIVHHGMFWAGAETLTGPAFRRVQRLIESDIAVYSSHLPLDKHPTLGNNVLLAKQLGLSPTAGFARFDNFFIGVSGGSDVDTSVLITRARQFAISNGGDARVAGLKEGRKTKRWAICTGAGAAADTLKEARESGVDTLIVGEGPHWTAVHAEENDLVIIYAGHYATETLGVRAVAQHLGEKFNLPWHFVSAPTGL